jgi:hypothetical protein
MSVNVKSMCITFKICTAERLEKARWIAHVTRSGFVESAVLEKIERMGLKK